MRGRSREKGKQRRDEWRGARESDTHPELPCSLGSNVKSWTAEICTVSRMEAFSFQSISIFNSLTKTSCGDEDETCTTKYTALDIQS